MLKKKSFRPHLLPASMASAILCTLMLLTGCSGNDGIEGITDCIPLSAGQRR